MKEGKVEERRGRWKERGGKEIEGEETRQGAGRKGVQPGGPRRDGHRNGRHAREIGVTCSAVWQLRAGAGGREIPEGREGCGVGCWEGKSRRHQRKGRSALYPRAQGEGSTEC